MPRRPRIQPIDSGRIFDYLREYVIGGGREPVTYGQVGRAIGRAPRTLDMPLGYIWRRCAQRDLPHINAIVVNKRTRRPGAGYSITGREWEEMIGRVFRYDWRQIRLS